MYKAGSFGGRGSIKESNLFSSVYEATTHDIRVCVDPVYLEEQSKPEEGVYFWAYYVLIENVGLQSVQLQSRTWKIIDAQGRMQCVHGEGVVGETPVLGPGQHFEYTSGTMLTTPSGFMMGTYHMALLSGGGFDVIIPPFSLDTPYHCAIRH